MKTDLKDYVRVIKSFLNKDVCNISLKELKKADWNKHIFYDAITKDKHSPAGDDELESTSIVLSTSAAIETKIDQIVKKYIEDLNFKWWTKFQGTTKLKFNRYSKNKRMENHCDHIHSLFDGKQKGIPLLTLVGVLNDNYTGGEFVLFEDMQIILKKGDLIIFPSLFLYPHMVQPVKKGTRYSFVSWAC